MNKRSDLEMACMRISREGGHPESWKTVRRIDAEMAHLRAEKEALIRSLVLSSRILRMDGHPGVMATAASIYVHEVGAVLADESPARFSLVVLFTRDGRREGRLLGAQDCRVQLGLLAEAYGGSGDSHYAIIPELPSIWRWPSDLESPVFQRQVSWEMT